VTLLFPTRPDVRSVPFARDLARHGDRIAVSTADAELSYRSLADRVAAVGRRLGTDRRLVLLAATNTVDSLVVYLAALASGHPILLVPGDQVPGDQGGSLESLVATYDPDVVVRTGAGECRFDERRAVTAHVLHPDLAVLLSTSGSTGSPKLVRLSHENVQANAESIAEYLGIRGSDRAATTLPMHYCYGLSVINTHLLRGAGLIVTDLSVADARFWELFRRGRGTSLAGVPYTFDLLDRVGFAEMRLPHLRYVTQAGGRLSPDRVRRYAQLGRRDGWDLVVMYGQTEATARMAYLPPSLAVAHPESIGLPIPGGSFRLEPLPDWPEPDTGELVYRGPNVMLGYAETPSDLRLGRTVAELYTGDIARRTGDGLYQLVGRRSRFVKVFGVRVDLQRVEAVLEGRGVTGCCVGDDEELVVAVPSGGDPVRIRRLAARACRLPVSAVRVCPLPELPRLPTGKVDHRAVRDLTGVGHRAAPAASGRSVPPPSAAGADLRELFAEILDRPDVTEDSSFVSLGGDSLSFVEMSVRLEQALGHLPPDWHTMPVRELRRAARRPTLRRALDTSAALRAIAIVFVVGTHAQLFDVSGGAHLLLAVVGFNVARFHLTSAERGERVRGLATSIAGIVAVSVSWIALAYLVTEDYTLAQVFLVNYLVGPPGFNDFWFIETVVYILVALCAAFAIPAVDRVERRFPLGLPLAVMALGLITRYHLVPGRLITPVVVVWLVALGWAAAKATNRWQRLGVTVAALATIPGFFGDPAREAVIVAGLVLLIWVPTLPSISPVNRVAAVLATSSLYIYLSHWQIFPRFGAESPLLAVIASLAGGVLYAAVARYLMARLRRPAAR